ncbi:hypothetical protein HAX54_052425 [Datura stramonium]|uniref:Uncharacterized protein n=1 Tax=Datura stramonium TaxID=4076 RepID=A0ABS8RRL2_DATST|nr:hypothetical protein [Datura stramonium]
MLGFCNLCYLPRKRRKKGDLHCNRGDARQSRIERVKDNFDIKFTHLFFCFANKTTETPVDSDSTAARTDESSEDQDDPLKKLTNFAGSVVNGALKWLRDNL